MSDAAMPEATELVAGYRDKSISPVEATQAALDAIEAYLAGKDMVALPATGRITAVG